MLNAVTDRLSQALNAVQRLLNRHTSIDSLREAVLPRIQKALTIYYVFYDASLVGNQGPETRAQAMKIAPFTAFNVDASVRDRALDCLRVVLNGKLSEEDKAYLRDERHIRPVPATAVDGSSAFRWEHPYVTDESVDMDIFSGISEGHIVPTEDEAWVDAYFAKAFWSE